MSTTMLSPRLQALREQIMSRRGSFPDGFNPFCRDVAIWRAAAPRRSVMQTRAALLHELVKIAPIQIPPDWSLAGEHLTANGSAVRGFSDRKVRESPDVIMELNVRPDNIPAIREASQGWGDRRREGLSSLVGNAPPEHSLGRITGWGRGGRGVYMASGWMENHSIRDYARVLREGFGGIRREVETRLHGADLSDPDYPRRANVWRAMLDVCDAGSLLGRRYAQHAEALAKRVDDPAAKARLARMAEVCRKVPEHPAATFFEAVQSLWFAHILTCGEDGINANSIGRLDRILYPYYAADVAAGRLTRDAAVTIMQEYACKMYLEYDVQAITLGGVDSEGHDAVNDLSYVIMDATEGVGFVRDLSVRLCAETPPEFVQRACELIVRGGGIPFIFNDDCFIKALTDRGIPLADARDYAPIGCIELTIPGKANPHAVSGWFNALKCLELALFDGRDPASGAQWGPATGALTDHADFDSLYAAYTAHVTCMAERMVYHCNRGELAQREHGPLPCWSLLTDDCIKRGRDITDEGCLYNYHSVCLMGVPNVADSLMALKSLVFEQGAIDAGELMSALEGNFKGQESLRQALLNHAPKYGNDVNDVDELAARVSNDFIDLMDTMRSPLNGRYFVHLFTFNQNIEFGSQVGATPDGRTSAEPLAYSLSAQQGRDREGVTAMLRSLSRLPHDRAAGSSAAIIDVDPAFVAGADGVALLKQLVTGAIAMRIGQLQWNVVSVDRLLKAREDPEHYGNIAVRVAGYSQMFKLISRDLQDHIIARTKHTS